MVRVVLAVEERESSAGKGSTGVGSRTRSRVGTTSLNCATETFQDTRARET